MCKKTILLDLDGVINTYNGSFDKYLIPPIKEGAFEFIKELSIEFKVVIFTSRNLFSAFQWIVNNNLEKYIEDVTNIKIPSYLIIDDRCISFNGNYSDALSQIKNFKVWYKD